MFKLNQVIKYIVILTFIGGPISTRAADNFLGWVPLYNSELILWLENENLIDKICPASLDITKKEVCRNENLKPKILELTVFDSPNSKHKVGSIFVAATPGRGLTATFKKLNTHQPISFIPDLFDNDWGYGPHFHQTVLKQTKDWVLLPKNPLSEPGWINLTEFGKDKPQLKPIEKETVYHLDQFAIIVLGFTKTGLSVRAEQPADMWCQEGNPPPLKKVKPLKVTHKNLFDKQGHLKLKLSYPRGC